MSSIWKNFKNYAKKGVVPAVQKNGDLVPANSFAKSVHYVDGVAGPVKDVLFGVKWHTYYPNNYINVASHHKPDDIYIGARGESKGIIKPIVFALTNIVLQTLNLAFVYLSYWPAKGLGKVTTGEFGLGRTESLVGYSNELSNDTEEHSKEIAKFINTVLSYAVTAVIWTVALLVTPIVWAVDKVASKFSETKVPEAAANSTEMGATGNI